MVVTPSLWFKLDEGLGDGTKEEISGASWPVAGSKSLWKQGVSATALEFDGYHTAVSVPAANAPALAGGSLTLEGWFALGAYPWNWAPIVQQGDDDGYFLGVDSHGYPGFMVKVDGVWQQLSVASTAPYTDANHLTLFAWYHAAGTYNKNDGMMRLYINGTEVASKLIGTGGVQTANAEVRVGKAGILRTPTEGGLPSEFGIDGLIDEVRIYNVALSAAQVAGSLANYNPGPAVVSAPDMQQRRLPIPTTNGTFSAVYTRLPYYETWDNLWRFGDYADVVVGFDKSPAKFVFWRGVSYIPMLVNESNQWFTHEFNETGFTASAPGDCEPMSDKPCLDSHVRIIENTDARKVIHWRYRLANPDHHWANYDENGWGDIADWYYYIYPDGVASKIMRCYSSKPGTWQEWNEQIVILGEGQHPESVISKQPVMTLVDSAGNATDYDWNPNPPSPQFRGQVIQQIHLTGQYHPFAIQNFESGDIYSGGRTWYSVFPSWNHWPTSQVNSSSRTASFPDRAAHSSISHLFWPYSSQQQGNISFQEKILMEGMTNQPAASLVSLAKSWLQAPLIEPLADCQDAAYVPAERAYHLTATGVAPSVRIAASAASPLVNLCLVVKDWPNPADAPALLLIDGVAQPAGADFRQGIVRDTNGNPMLVGWVSRQATTPVTFTLLTKPSAPTGLSATPGLAAAALNWAPSFGASGYTVWRRNTLSGVVQVDAVTTPSCMNTGLDIGTPYEFKVCASSSSGDSDWSQLVSATPTASKGSQTITFDLGLTLNKAWNDPPFADPAAASTGLPVSYSTDDPAVATVDAGTGMVTITGKGTVHLLADQAGDAAFEPAPQKSQILTVGKANQTITFDHGLTLNKAWNDPPFADAATASSGLAVIYSSDNPAVATVDASTGMVTIKAIGIANLLADQAGNASYNPAAQVSQTLTVRSIAAASSYGSNHIPFVNSGTLVGAAVFGNAGTYDGIPFALWSSPYTTAKQLGSGVSAVASPSFSNIDSNLGGDGQYATAAYTSGSAAGSLTISGLVAGQTYRFQCGFCDKRVGSYPYSVNAILTLSDASTTPVPLSIGAATTDDDYALLTATVSGSTSLRLDLPQAANGVGPIIAGFSVHRIDTGGVAPTSTNDVLDIKKNASATLSLGDFGTYSDPQSLPLAAVRISTLPNSGSLQFDTTGTGNWTNVTLNQEISAAHISAGRLSFTPAPNTTGSPYAMIEFKVGNGTLFSGPYTLTINVTSVSSIAATSSNSSNHIPFANSGTLVGAAVFGNAGTYDGIPFSLWNTPFTTPMSLGSGVSVAMGVTGGDGGGSVTGTAFRTDQQYQYGAYTNSTPRGMTLTFTGLDSSRQYRFQFGYGDTRTNCAYNETVSLAFSSGAPFPVQLAFGSAAAGDEYALLTATVTNSTSLVLTLPQTVAGYHGPMQAGFSVHLIGGGTGYDSWAAANAGGQTAELDCDRDGIANGIEYFMGETASPFTATPAVLNTGGVLTWTWPYNPSAAATYKFQLSGDLVDWSTEFAPPDPAIRITPPVPPATLGSVKFTLPTGPSKRYCRLALTPNP